VRDKVLEELREVDTVLAAAQGGGRDGMPAPPPAGRAALPPLPEVAVSHRPHTAEQLGPRIAEELGDLLFAIANWSLHLGIDPEEALRGANGKFERRFRHMEAVARQRGVALETLSASEWDELWRGAKQA